MADNERISTPASSTGIMRFYDVNASAIQLDPRIIMGFSIAFVALILLAQVHL